MLIPLKDGELHRLIPAVATGPQFNFCSGNPAQDPAAVLISVIGGVLSLLIAQSRIAMRFGPIWLVCGFVFLLYILWGPIVEAGRRNATLRRYKAGAIFEGVVADLFTRERIVERKEQADGRGRLELVENRRHLASAPARRRGGLPGARCVSRWTKKHKTIRKGMAIRCLVLSERPDFSRIGALSDAWIPGLKALGRGVPVSVAASL